MNSSGRSPGLLFRCSLLNSSIRIGTKPITQLPFLSLTHPQPPTILCDFFQLCLFGRIPGILNSPAGKSQPGAGGSRPNGAMAPVQPLPKVYIHTARQQTIPQPVSVRTGRPVGRAPAHRRNQSPKREGEPRRPQPTLALLPSPLRMASRRPPLTCSKLA